MTIQRLAQPLLWEDRQRPRVLCLEFKSNQFGGVSNDQRKKIAEAVRLAVANGAEPGHVLNVRASRD
ncbi:MAG: hypothetical protein QOI77_2967 [Blastocatellia bacterium]|nr:hypothetical protein [Blastocatellia bacterium]